MGTRYVCQNELRRRAVRAHSTLNGIDFLEVLDRDAPAGSPQQRTLLVRLMKPVPTGLNEKNVRIRGGVRVQQIKVAWAAAASDAPILFDEGKISAAERTFLLGQPDPGYLFVVRTSTTGDFSTYSLSLIEGAPGPAPSPPDGPHSPPDGDEEAPHSAFDVVLSEITFSFKVECPSEFDCRPETVCPPQPGEVPPIDYLARDYGSFRQVMLDRLSVIMPDWKDRSAADPGIAVIELMAYVSDYLSYYQDAVATEAYLGTSRQRTSVRRHARLLAYDVHDGCNARAWVHFQVDAGVNDALLRWKYLPGKTTRLLTRVASETTRIPEEDFSRVMGDRRPEVFEPMYDLRLYEAHNEISFYTWGDEDCCLPKGATAATLYDDEANRLRLRPGDVLVFEERLGPGTGDEADADPTHRHAVRLIRVDPAAELTDLQDGTGERVPGPLRTDVLFDQPIVRIEWMEEDALPFPLCLSTVIRGDEQPERKLNDVSVARGNIVLADHGRTIGDLAAEASLEQLIVPPGERPFRPRLAEANVTQRVRFDPIAWANFDPDRPGTLSAAEATTQDPRESLPALTLVSRERDETWLPQRGLLASDRFDLHLVVEVDNDGSARLRFGDNVFGKRPLQGQRFEAGYRTGSGAAGNVGAGAIAHIVTTLAGITNVRNPMPATGGTNPERLEAVRQFAPQAFRKQERAVTAADYAEIAGRHRSVDRAAATRRWTGSWHTMFITVDRKGGKLVDQAFEAELAGWVDQYRLAGHDVEIEPPSLVPLDIAFTVCVKPNYLRSDVKLSLLEVFSNRDLPDGRRGFFHPDNFTFGQPVYLSRLVAAAMDVAGVRWVEFNEEVLPPRQPARFKRWGEPTHGEIGKGMIEMGRLEIAQLDNDPNKPENGKIEFFMEGGL